MNQALRSVRRAGAVVLLSLSPALLLTASNAEAASLQQVQNFGDNPSNISMYLYVPDKVAPSPPVVVALHYCTGTASAYFSGLAAGLVSLANQHGFIMIFPQTTAYGSCWDVFSKASLSHSGGSDSAGIVSMVKYVISQHKADPGRVYAVGNSSGAMMTNVLLGAIRTCSRPAQRTPASRSAAGSGRIPRADGTRPARTARSRRQGSSGATSCEARIPLHR